MSDLPSEVKVEAECSWMKSSEVSAACATYFDPNHFADRMYPVNSKTNLKPSLLIKSAQARGRPWQHSQTWRVWPAVRSLLQRMAHCLFVWASCKALTRQVGKIYSWKKYQYLGCCVLDGQSRFARTNFVRDSAESGLSQSSTSS